MKNKKAFLHLLTALMVSFTGVYAFTVSHTDETSTSSIYNSVSDSTVTKTYTCSMHPEVISDKPGTYPNCGMDLVLKEDDNKKDEKKDEEHDRKKHKGCMGH